VTGVRQVDHHYRRFLDAPRAAGVRAPLGALPFAALLLAALALSALSLLGPWALAFDPAAWAVWGREVTRLALDTGAGPSWKPLPVVLTTPFALAGEAAPALWVVVARAGSLLALAGAWRLGRRLGGAAAGAGAALALALSPWWAYNAALGNSEGLLAAAVLWAVLAHLDGRPRLALALGVAAGLLRPEAWPFLGLYAWWLWRSRILPARTLARALAPLPLLWLGPDLLGVGGAFAASHHALGPASPDSAGNADVPALAVLADAVELVTLPAALAALFSGARWLALGALAWIGLVAVETQAGYAGNPRYLAAAAAVGAVLAGVGAARAAGALAARVGRAAAGALARVGRAAAGASGAATRRPAAGLPARRGRAAPLTAPFIGAALLATLVAIASAGELRDQAREVELRDASRRGLARVVDAVGGAAAVRACGTVRTSAAMRAAVAWEVDVPLEDLEQPPVAPGVVLRGRPFDGGPPRPLPPRGFTLAARAPGWELWWTCS